MNQLETARQQIDEIDTQLAALFEKRFHAVEDVIAYKMQNGMEIKDSGREQVIIQKNTALIESDAIRPFFQDFYEHMIALSRQYQKQLQNEEHHFL